MKNFYVILFIFISSFTFSQEKKNILSKFNTSGMETSILYQKTPITNIDVYNETTTNTYKFYQAYKAMAQGDLLQRFGLLELIKEQTKLSYFTTIIPLAILHCDYETIDNNAITNDADGFLLRSNSNQDVFEKHNITVSSPLRVSSIGLHTSFNLSSNNIYNTTTNEIQRVEINFSDGLGFRNVRLNQNIEVNYTEAGKKTLMFKIILNNGDLITNSSSIVIKYSNADLYTIFNRIVTTFNSTISSDFPVEYGEPDLPGTGEYEIFLSPDNVLDKPIILVDGFDPGDGRPISGYTDGTTGNYITGIYDLLNFDDAGTISNLGDLVRTEGYDVVILNFPVYTRTVDMAIIDGGVDFIERNAMLLVDLINIINTQKVGAEQNVIIGPSMGGLISRYALNYMENQTLDHDTRLWISFDSPHHGANVPIGFQHQFNYLAYGLNDFTFIGNQNVEELQPIINGMLKSSAARQMLTDQLEAHFISSNPQEVEFNNSNTLPQSHPFKSIFYDRLNGLTTSGFPENIRKVSIINGSGTNSRYKDKNGMDLLAGRQILNTTFNVALGTDATLRTNFTPPLGTQINVSHVYIDFAWYIPAFDVTSNANSLAYNFSDGIDASSGGLFDILALTADLDTTGLIGNFLNALQTDFFNFIPSVSAMAFEITSDEINWFHTPSNVMTGRATSNVTPFDAWYMPVDNEPHVTLTEQNVEFALSEIIQPTLSIETETSDSIKLEQNPISNTLTILSSNFIENSKISLIDVTGKKVYSTIVNLTDRTKLPINLSSGLYVLQIETRNNTILRTKIIVK